MIIERNTFHLHFGKAREAIALWQEVKPAIQRMGYPGPLILTDLTGEFYTLVVEFAWNSLAEWESAASKTGQSQEWREWYARFVPLVHEGRREVFKIVE